MITVRAPKRLDQNDWEQLQGSPLAESMVRNRIEINGFRRWMHQRVDSDETSVLLYIDQHASGIYYLIIDNEAHSIEDETRWAIYFEHEKDRDEIMAWIKLKYEGRDLEMIDEESKSVGSTAGSILSRIRANSKTTMSGYVGPSHDDAIDMAF